MSKLFTINYYKYFYDIILNKSRTEKEVSFIKKYLEITKQDKILDLSCWFWRHTEILLNKWFNVYWIDISKSFISYIKRKSNFKEKYIYWDIRKEIKEKDFNKIYSLHTSFWYFNDKENEKTIKNISNILLNKGQFLLDLNNPYDKNLFLEWESKLEKWEDYILDKKIVKNNRLFFKRTIKKWKRIIDEDYSLRIYTDKELGDIWNKYNLKLIKKYWDFDWNKFTKSSKRMILIFEKY